MKDVKKMFVCITAALIGALEVEAVRRLLRRGQGEDSSLPSELEFGSPSDVEPARSESSGLAQDRNMETIVYSKESGSLGFGRDAS